MSREKTELLKNVEMVQTGMYTPPHLPRMLKIDEDFSPYSPNESLREYKLSVTIGFKTRLHPRVSREHIHEEALRAIAHFVYGEVLNDMKDLLPELTELYASGDDDLIRLADRIHRIMDKMSP